MALPAARATVVEPVPVSPLRDGIANARERAIWNAALERAVEIAGPQYHKAKPGLWSREKQRLADEISACKLENVGA